MFPLARHERGRSNDDLWAETTEEVRDRLAEIGIGALEEIAQKYNSYSTRGFLKAEGLSEAAIERYGVLTVVGGMDQLPAAFHQNQDPDSVTVHTRTGTDRRAFRADFSICTLPFSAMRHIEADPAFSPGRQKAIRAERVAEAARGMA
ncbi:FAD-dependent oxidoreductase [Catenulispora sp. GP43]|uniref:FAD-dependent oxidoreductase n=1 Tax=Catenulispora sp. GP43 TaxID=3156263 RepID=UPI003516F004